MKNKRITPSEINKFLYCNYQWYYERKYGINKLKSFYKNKNKTSDYNNSVGNLKRGIDFHNNYLKENNKKIKFRFLKLIVIIITITSLLIITKVMFI